MPAYGGDFLGVDERQRKRFTPVCRRICNRHIALKRKQSLVIMTVLLHSQRKRHRESFCLLRGHCLLQWRKVATGNRESF